MDSELFEVALPLVFTSRDIINLINLTFVELSKVAWVNK